MRNIAYVLLGVLIGCSGTDTDYELYNKIETKIDDLSSEIYYHGETLTTREHPQLVCKNLAYKIAELYDRYKHFDPIPEERFLELYEELNDLCWVAARETERRAK